MVKISIMNRNISIILLAIFCGWSPISINACDEIFEGFGVHLGSIDHFAASPPGTVRQVVDLIYNDLGIRHFRTSYESTFSPRRNVYEIVCGSNARICSWIEVMRIISKYRNTSIMASIWSPPAYMVNQTLFTLPEIEEPNFLYFIRNVTELIRTQYNINIDRISPVNEPENIFAEWEHLYMPAHQLCRMVKEFNDSLVSICPENSYFGTSITFAGTPDPTCFETCTIFGSHAYRLHIVSGGFRAYYDLVAQDRRIPENIPIWQTEVSSTFDDAANNQMREALDLAINIANFVGHTCIQRYYFWLSYTLNASGESLIWGNIDGDLMLPKKYYAYRHFTLAAQGSPTKVNKYNPVSGVTYLTFELTNAVFVNNLTTNVTTDWTDFSNCVLRTFFCTTEVYDWSRPGNDSVVVLPAESICSCLLN